MDINAEARAEYVRLNPRRSVPTIKIGNEVVVGFRNFQYVPVVAYLTLREPTQALKRRIQSKAKDVGIFFASVFE